MSSSLTTRISVPSILTSVPAYLPNNTLSPTFTVGARVLPLSSALPEPTAMTSPLMGFSVAESGMTMPPADIFSSSIRLMTTRSYSGLMFMTWPLRFNENNDLGNNGMGLLALCPDECQF